MLPAKGEGTRWARLSVRLSRFAEVGSSCFQSPSPGADDASEVVPTSARVMKRRSSDGARCDWGGAFLVSHPLCLRGEDGRTSLMAGVGSPLWGDEPG